MGAASGQTIRICFGGLSKSNEIEKLNEFHQNTVLYEEKGSFFFLEEAGLRAELLSLQHYRIDSAENLDLEIQLMERTQGPIGNVLDYFSETIAEVYDLPHWMFEGKKYAGPEENFSI